MRIRSSACSLPFKVLLVGLGALPLVGCGGSASESPWPVPPESTVTGPAGEDGPPSATSDANAQKDPMKAAAPNVKP